VETEVDKCMRGVIEDITDLRKGTGRIQRKEIARE
jgi:hypothetical protein